MTSKNSFLQISKWNFKKRMPYMVLGFLGCFFFMPVVTFMNCMLSIKSILQQAGGRSDSSYYLNEIVWLKGNSVVNAAFGDGFHILLVAVLAFLFAITAFSWNNSIQKVDFYKSLPVKEKVRFGYIHGNSLIMFVLCYGINLILSNLSAAYWGLCSEKMIMASIYSLFYHTLCFIAIYFLVSIAQQLTGSSILAVFGGLFLFFVEPLMLLLKEVVKSENYATYYAGYRSSDFLAMKAGIFTPLSAYMKGYYSVYDQYLHFLERSNYKAMMPSILLLCLQIVVYGAFTYFLYKYRKSYASNQNITFSFAKPVIKILVMVAASFTLGIVFNEFSDNTLEAGLFGVISGVILTQLILQFVMEGDFRKVVKGIPSMLIGAVISLSVFLYYPLTARSYDTYLPQKEEITSVSVVRNDEYMKDFYDEHGQSLNSRKYLIDSLSFDDQQVIGKLVDTLQVSMDENHFTTNTMRMFDAEVVEVRFTLKNGKKVYRSYYLEKEKVRPIYDLYYGSENYKTVANPLVHDVFDKTINPDASLLEILYTSCLCDDEQLIVSDEAEYNELYQAIKQDLYDRSVETENTQAPIGTMKICGALSDVNYHVSYTNMVYGSSLIMVYESDKRIMAFLAKKGLDKTTIQTDRIESIEVFKDRVAEENINMQSEGNVAEENVFAEKLYDWSGVEEEPIIVLHKGDDLFQEVIQNSYVTDAIDRVMDNEKIQEPFYYTRIHLTNGVEVNGYILKGRVPKEIVSLASKQ